MSNEQALISDPEKVTAYAQDLSTYLRGTNRDLTKAILGELIEKVRVLPGEHPDTATLIIRYRVPNPPSGWTQKTDVEELLLRSDVRSLETSAKAGTQENLRASNVDPILHSLDSRFRGNDDGMSTRSDHMGAGLEPASTPDMTSPTPWQTATVERVVVETYRARTFTLRLSEPRPLRAGQHYDVRLTAPDGYQAQRSYSVASPPQDTDCIDLTVELIPDGEVSPYFHEVVQPGDELEVRGPIGGPFTWGPELGGPLLLLAGGSGIVPIRSILAHREAVAPDLPALLLYSARSPEDIIYRKWLDDTAERCPGVAALYALTRRQPQGWTGYARRVDADMLRDCTAELARLNGGRAAPLCYACGPTGFVEAAADTLLEVDIPEAAIRTERFGPTT